MINSIIGIVSGVSLTTIANYGELAWWQYLLISIVPPLIGAICDIVLAILKKKGIISKTTANKINDTVDDLLDDGKLNDSNKNNEK